MTDLQLAKAAFNEWYLGPLGQEVLTQECEQLKRFWSQINGSSILQLGNNELIKKSAGKKTVRPVYLSTEFIERPSGIQGSYQHMPFPDGSMDVLLLPHILEFETHIHPVLKEAWRVLANNGRLIIFGFNPWSFWGLRRLFSQKKMDVWGSHFRSGEKLRGYFNQLGAEILVYNNLLFRPPVNNKNFLKRFRWLEQVMRFSFPASGGIYLLVVKKNVMPVSAVKLRWRWQNLFAENKGLEPTTRRDSVSKV